MKRNRLAAWTIAATMTLGTIVSGCGDAEQDAKEKNTANTENTENSEQEEEKSSETGSEDEELTVWVWDPAFSIYSIKEAEKIYQREHPGFRLNVVDTPSDDVETKVMTMAEADNLKDLPDIFCLQDSSFQKMYQNYPQVFSDLTDTNIDFDQFVDAKASVSYIDGKRYGIPFDTGTSIFAVRTDYLEQAGHTIEDVTDVTWDEFIEVGKDVLEATGNPMLLSVSGAPDLLMQMMQSAGKSIFQEDGSVKIEDNEVLLECIRIYNEMRELGILREILSGDEQSTALATGTTAGVMSGCWILASVQMAEDQSGKWAVTNVPSLEGVEGATNYSNLGGSTWVISSNCKNKELAADFFASTFGGNVEFYETVFPSTGLVSPCISVGESGIYDKELEFFQGQKVFHDVAEYATKVPSVPYGKYYFEARAALGVALTNAGTDGNIEEELRLAQENVDFVMDSSGS